MHFRNTETLRLSNERVKPRDCDAQEKQVHVYYGTNSQSDHNDRSRTNGRIHQPFSNRSPFFGTTLFTRSSGSASKKAKKHV